MNNLGSDQKMPAGTSNQLCRLRHSHTECGGWGSRAVNYNTEMTEVVQIVKLVALDFQICCKLQCFFQAKTYFSNTFILSIPFLGCEQSLHLFGRH